MIWSTLLIDTFWRRMSQIKNCLKVFNDSIRCRLPYLRSVISRHFWKWWFEGYETKPALILASPNMLTDVLSRALETEATKQGARGPPVRIMAYPTEDTEQILRSHQRRRRRFNAGHEKRRANLTLRLQKPVFEQK